MFKKKLKTKIKGNTTAKEQLITIFKVRHC